VANGEQWNIACYANGTTADSTAVTIDGWTTGVQNFINVYTPTSESEVGVSQRHSGKWDENKYKLIAFEPLKVYEHYTQIIGLQVGDDTTSAYSNKAISSTYTNNKYQLYDSLIIRKYAGSNFAYRAFGMSDYPTGTVLKNSVIYDFDGSTYGAITSSYDNSSNFLTVENVTIYNSQRGVRRYQGSYAKLINVLAYNNSSGDFDVNGGSWHTDSNYNLSSDGSAPGANSKTNQTVAFVDAANRDLHLALTDTAAKNSGTDLSTYFTNDIDGATRTSASAWDIGADETATQIYRSVGPSATSALATDSSHANTVAVSSGTATFSAALPDNIGVGDAVLVDTGGTANAIDSSDTILFIHSRTSSTSYTLRTHTGSVPGDIAINDTYSIYRAYTSLANAEAGTKNTSIPITFNGGNRDLVTNNEEWNIACYANGTTADTTAVTIDGWGTAQQNFVKIYTPVNTSEVGVSQRHSGKWDESKYILTNSEYTYTIIISSGYVFLDGLQVYSNVTYKGAVYLGGQNDPVINSIKNSILKSNSNPDVRGIYATNWQMTYYIYNNLIIDFSIGIHRADGNTYIYNNTVVNSNEYGIFSGGWRVGMAKNNIVQNCANGFEGAFTAGSDYNISDISGDAPNATFTGGTADVQFVNEAGYDFHLAQTDTTARGAGANLTADANLPFSTDIDGQLRNPAGAGWDIGADEGTVEFVSTVMQSGGNFSTLSSWEDAIDSDLVADTTRVFAHGGITGTIVGGNTVTGLTSGATATVVYATSTQILLHTVSGIFQSGETVQVSSGNSVVISDNGNPASAVAKIDGAWSVADTTAVLVDGWISGPDNYIKIYTAPAARHSGKWDEGKYRMGTPGSTGDPGIAIEENYVCVDGLQVYKEKTIYSSGDPVFISGAYAGDIQISNSIIRAIQTLDGYDTAGIRIYIAGYHTKNFRIYNNIFYGFKDPSNTHGKAISATTYGTLYLFNNTITNSYQGVFDTYDGGSLKVVAKNNISNNNVIDYFSGTFDSSSSNNISSDSTAPGTNSKTGTTVSFISTTSGSEDFHLSQSDTAAKNAGTDLSTYFTTDIDGATRNSSINNWDIGADETATQIFRSVGPSATGLLDSDNSHADELLSITGGVATFEVAVADNIGVGDVLIVDTNNDETITSADTLLFISGRNSSTSYNLQANDGSVPGDIPINDTWQIYRAYTSLANAEAGTTINSGISSLGFSAFNGGDRDLLANNEEWNIACYANGTTADTTGVGIDGWNTGASNFIKIFTPVINTEVGVSQRHSGKWLSSAYFRDEGIGIEDSISYVIVDGMQISRATSGTWAFGLLANDTIDSGFIVFKNNIIKGVLSGSANSNWGIFKRSGSGCVLHVYNNIVYDFDLVDNRGIHIEALNNDSVYNNTVYNCHQGIRKNGSMNVSNNIVQGGDGEDYYSVSGGVTANNNISSDGTAWGTNSKINTTVSFIDETNDDFHLSQSDTTAKDAGTDLSTYFSTDIDGATRTTVTAWDIGADETATRIFRSVGPSATGLLASDSSHANTVTLTSGVATFSVALADNIGVGDAVIVDTGGTDQAIDASDTLLFISGRNSSTSYNLRTHTGAVPANITSNDTYSIYRAYTSLYNAEAGTKNTSIPITFNGGNRDLVTNNEEWNITCYANGITADTTALTIDGWNTGAYNFLKVYTPVTTNEVGATQRHGGKWDDNKYQLSTADPFGGSMLISSSYTIIDGIQIKYTAAMDYGNLRVVSIGDTSNSPKIQNSIITSIDTYTNNIRGIAVGDAIGMNQYINNNIIYGSGLDEGIEILYAGTPYVYNNTIYGVTTGINRNSGTIIAKNNIVQNCTDGFLGTFDPSSDYNISDIVDDAPSPSYRSGLATDVAFVNEAGYDFHLAQTDTVARGAGANLTAEIATSEYLLAMTKDIDGQLRNPSGAGWDIGADEGTVEFVSTVMQSGGNFSTLSSWEDAIDSDLVADTTRVFAHGGITGTIVGGNTVTGLTSGATATVVYATSTQILLHTVSGIFQSGETLEVTAGNSVVISDNGNPASAVAKIDGAWTVADTTAVTVDGWATGPDNYIKIYTAPDARHNGKWDDSKYRLNTTGSSLSTIEDHSIIEGLQITTSGGYIRTVELYDNYGIFSKNIVKSIPTSPAVYSIGDFSRIDNNIVYGSSSQTCIAVSYDLSRYRFELYNNTVSDCETGIKNLFWTSLIAKNNISVNNTVADFEKTMYSSFSSNNISSDATAPGSSGSKINAEVKFISTEAGNEDFHLHPDDRFAIDTGTDLSTYFTTDIDGQTRLRQDSGVAQWDIGADETATRIYRSVGPGKNDTLDNDTSHSKNVTLTAGVATFSAPLPDNVGVGDVVIIDTDNDEAITSADTLLFISRRNSSTSYKLQTNDGATPSDITINDTYQIYRAHTSLADAEAGTINSALSTMGFAAFNGGNRDLVANNEQWNIACYANGTTADTTVVGVDGWVTGVNNFLKIYTPVEINEVGVTQRHDGKWDDNKYKLAIGDGPDNGSIQNNLAYMKIEGLQISKVVSNFSSPSGVSIQGAEEGEIIISKNIIKMTDTSIYSHGGITYYKGSSPGNQIVKIYNNLIYDIKNINNAGYGISISQYGIHNIYNNTVINSGVGYGYHNIAGEVTLKNNIAQDCNDGYYLESGVSWEPESDYNISDLAADAPGANSKNLTNVLFLDEANDDFRLSSDDTAAKGAGLNLSTDTDLSFFDDIRGQARPASPTAWSIGASEPQSAGKIKLEGTQIKMEGDAKFE
jgi:hypothetical protein